ncbi:hypothetical protein [Mycolicibacterium houstonense]|uniref:hypothetical protein n=1 Tax=Mycolicibacterium houstonense TaxID=146021 RepID=UPI003F96D0FC
MAERRIWLSLSVAVSGCGDVEAGGSAGDWLVGVSVAGGVASSGSGPGAGESGTAVFAAIDERPCRGPCRRSAGFLGPCPVLTLGLVDDPQAWPVDDPDVWPEVPEVCPDVDPDTEPPEVPEESEAPGAAHATA